MIIVRVSSGLGNQMFQYALYLSLKERKDDVKMDLSYYDFNSPHNGYELDSVFGIVGDVASNQESLEFGDIKRGFLSRARRKFVYLKKTHYKEKKFSYNREVFEIDNVYLSGYWQTEKYFCEIENKIKSAFVFKRDIGEYNASIIRKMREKESVSIHIRRGDYEGETKTSKKHGRICDLDYYEKAIRFMKLRVGKSDFYVFSDEPNWVRENLKIENAVYVDWNTGKNSYLDMQLMSNCRHNIIANSSFSWWGAWLNDNTEKIVVAPGKWFNSDEDISDIVPLGWHKLMINN